MDLPGLNSLPEAFREPLRHYAERLSDFGSPHVLGLTLYGAIAGPGFDASVHTIRNVLFIDAVGLGILRKISTEGYRFGRNYITAPLVMTPEFLQASLDTFPLELIEVQERRLVLFGEDYFASIAPEAAHVRLQCERELKVLAVGMRQAVVADGASEAALRRAATPTIYSVLRVLRGLLWLKNRREPLQATAVLVEVENLAGRHLPGIRQAFEAPASIDWLVFEKLYDDIEALGHLSDGW
jgi:hypothetical protein